VNAPYKVQVKHALFTIKEKTLILAMLTLLFIALLIPVSQVAKSRQITLRLQAIENEVQLIEEEARILRAQMAEAVLPEVLLEHASVANLTLEKILSENIKIVTVKEE